MATAQAIPSSPESDLRARILVAATRLFADRGYAATSMRDIADTVSCTKPALYYYFACKAALFTEVIRTENERIIALLQQSLNQAGSVRERMRVAMHGYFDYLRHNPVGLRVLLRAELHVEHGQPALDFRSMRQAYIDLVTRLLHEGIEAGEIRLDVAVEDAMHVLAGAVDMRAALFIMDGEPIPRDYPERILALVFGGIGR
jgi:AcrR family transcriptional regulator